MTNIKNKNRYLVLTLGCIAAVLMTGVYYNDSKKKTTDNQKKFAAVLKHDIQNKANLDKISLDMDNNPRTAEATCEVNLKKIAPLSEQDLQEILPVGTRRSVWEWKKIGHLTQVNEL